MLKLQREQFQRKRIKIGFDLAGLLAVGLLALRVDGLVGLLTLRARHLLVCSRRHAY
jgi:hypothetical protein